jgi:hypothetical protein
MHSIRIVDQRTASDPAFAEQLDRLDRTIEG